MKPKTTPSNIFVSYKPSANNVQKISLQSLRFAANKSVSARVCHPGNDKKITSGVIKLKLKAA